MSTGSCHAEKPQPCGGCGSKKNRPDYFFIICLSLVTALYAHFAIAPSSTQFSNIYHVLAHGVFELMNTVWIGIVIGILMLSVLSKIPRELVMSILGTNKGSVGLFRATLAGVFLDLCSHGILMVGAKLYERGASIGQVMAFLIASPWNSFSLTIILITLIGFYWTIAFIVLSMLIALITGYVFDLLVKRGVLPSNPNQFDLPVDFNFFRELKVHFSTKQWSFSAALAMIKQGVIESKMVVRWLLFGVLIASFLRAVVEPQMFAEYFGPSMVGLMITILAATIIEVCSEGSTPIAADILNNASAPGNGFAFLMAGVSTDYTELMVVKDTARSWKIALFLPLITLPQIVFIAYLLNLY